MKRSHITIFVFLSLFCSLSPTIGFAGAGTSGGGVGDKNGVPLDTYSDENALYEGKLNRIDPQELPAFRKTVRPMIEKIDRKLPGFAEEFTRALKEKRWFSTNAKLARTNDECLVLDIGTQQIAVQNSEKVVFDEEWLKADKNQQYVATMLVHEMLMHLNGENLCSTRVRKATKILIKESGDLDDVKLQKKLASNGFFTDLLTRSEVLAARSQVIGLMADFEDFCSERISTQMTYDEVRPLLSRARDSIKRALFTTVNSTPINWYDHEIHGNLDTIWGEMSMIGADTYGRRDDENLTGKAAQYIKSVQRETCSKYQAWKKSSLPKGSHEENRRGNYDYRNEGESGSDRYDDSSFIPAR